MLLQALHFNPDAGCTHRKANRVVNYTKPGITKSGNVPRGTWRGPRVAIYFLKPVKRNLRLLNKKDR